MNVNLGFAEKVASWMLESKFFPSKIGGYPSWLSFESLPSEPHLLCRKCNRTLVFLCQIYAPITSRDDCFHRTLFVFICRDGKCCSLNNSDNIQVFRSQLPRVNKFYSALPPKEEESSSSDCDISSFTRICRVCGSHGSKVCGNCKLVSYCSRDHQILDWKADHKLECKQKELSSRWSKASKNVIFPEYEIDLEAEELENKSEEPEGKRDFECEENEEQTSLAKMTNPVANHEFSEDDLMKMAKQETDKEFSKFKSRISEYPGQVIRYERSGFPLFASSENKPISIPECEHCGGRRIFEFQIMPQLLVYLKVDSVEESIDWGTIIIYTCENSCSPDKEMYMKEICFKQDYSHTS